MYPLAALVFFASIAVPMLKLVGLTHHAGRDADRSDGAGCAIATRLYHVVRWIGRWSMIDIFMEALLGALVRFGSVITIEPGIGAVAFCGVVILTMFAAETFDPRLMWDAAERAEAMRAGVRRPRLLFVCDVDARPGRVGVEAGDRASRRRRRSRRLAMGGWRRCGGHQGDTREQGDCPARHFRPQTRRDQNTRVPPTTARVTANTGLSTASGTRTANRLPRMMPGIEPISSDTSIETLTDPQHPVAETGDQCQRHCVRDIGADDARHRQPRRTAESSTVTPIAPAPTEEIVTSTPSTRPVTTVSIDVCRAETGPR